MTARTGLDAEPVAPAWPGEGRVVAHVRIAPPPAGWRDALAARLGQRPRRLGGWAELALHGALACLDEAGEPTLPAGATLVVASQWGPLSAIRDIVSQSADGLPMPFSFMQSQPGLMLSALCRHLAWSGDARFVTGRDLASMVDLAETGLGAAGLLFGWVDEDRRSDWWRVTPCPRGG